MTFTDGESGAQGSRKAREGQTGIKPAEWRLSPTQTVLRSTLHSPTPPPSLSWPNAPWRTPPRPAPPQPDQRMPGARGRSPAWSKEPVLPGPRNHPSLCRARSRHLPPAPSSQVLRPQARTALDSSHTSTSSLWMWGLWSRSPRPLNDPPSFLPRLPQWLTRPPCLCPCSPHSAPGTAVGVNLIKYIRSSHSFTLSLLMSRPKASLPVTSTALPSPLAASSPHTPSSYTEKTAALLQESPTRYPSSVPGHCLGGL